jgi:hypothetical protein
VRWIGIAALLLATSPLLAEEKAEEGFVSLFDGKTLSGWQGDTEGYVAEDGKLVCQRRRGKRLYTAKEYTDFIFRFEFRQEPGTQGNNGVAIRAPLGGKNLEIQVFNNHHPRAKKLKPYQLHGSIYGIVPAKPGHLKPAGEWNAQEILFQGRRVRVTLNGAVIVDADLDKVGHGRYGRRKKGLIGFCGHSDRIEFRNLRIKELK